MTSTEAKWGAVSVYGGPFESPGFVLWRDFMRWQRGLNAVLKTFDLTQPQFAVLAVAGWLTREGKQVTQQEVVDFLKLDRMHISQIATRLELKGLIRRQASKTDLRSKIVTLTRDGHEKLTLVMPVVEAFDQAFFTQKHL
ncbi:MarR family winged helix-turn-helix transcriptional regulator [Brucella pseudogrignonensis]|uniref:MarR family winged helix-turn-helix transcriptional regulator n=1 Tax=Brucella pseudogrignonensis TaxID=419475 RepID=UPI0038B66444